MKATVRAKSLSSNLRPPPRRPPTKDGHSGARIEAKRDESSHEPVQEACKDWFQASSQECPTNFHPKSSALETIVRNNKFMTIYLPALLVIASDAHSLLFYPGHVVTIMLATAYIRWMCRWTGDAYWSRP